MYHSRVIHSPDNNANKNDNDDGDRNDVNSIFYLKKGVVGTIH